MGIVFAFTDGWFSDSTDWEDARYTLAVSEQVPKKRVLEQNFDFLTGELRERK